MTKKHDSKSSSSSSSSSSDEEEKKKSTPVHKVQIAFEEGSNDDGEGVTKKRDKKRDKKAESKNTFAKRVSSITDYSSFTQFINSHVHRNYQKNAEDKTFLERHADFVDAFQDFASDKA